MKKLIRSTSILALAAAIAFLPGCGTTDLTPPIITLNGDAVVIIVLGGTYTDAGYTATDEEDGDLSGNVTVTGESDIDTDKLGKYTITYSVSDAAGNTDVTSREVWVIADKGTYSGSFTNDGTIWDVSDMAGTSVDNDYTTDIVASSTDGVILIDNLGDYEFWGSDPSYKVQAVIGGDLGNELTISYTASTGRTFTGTGTLSDDGNTITLSYEQNDGGSVTFGHSDTFTRL